MKILRQVGIGFVVAGVLTLAISMLPVWPHGLKLIVGIGGGVIAGLLVVIGANAIWPDLLEPKKRSRTRSRPPTSKSTE